MTSLAGSCFECCNPVCCAAWLMSPSIINMFFILFSAISMPACTGCYTPICCPHLSLLSFQTIFLVVLLRGWSVCFICLMHVKDDSTLCSCVRIRYSSAVFVGCQPLYTGWVFCVHAGDCWHCQASLISAATCGIIMLLSATVSGFKLIFVFGTVVSVFSLLIPLISQSKLFTSRSHGDPWWGFLEKKK